MEGGSGEENKKEEEEEEEEERINRRKKESCNRVGHVSQAATVVPVTRAAPTPRHLASANATLSRYPCQIAPLRAKVLLFIRFFFVCVAFHLVAFYVCERNAADDASDAVRIRRRSARFRRYSAPRRRRLRRR